jgi:hypothetical protein
MQVYTFSRKVLKYQSVIRIMPILREGGAYPKKGSVPYNLSLENEKFVNVT